VNIAKQLYELQEVEFELEAKTAELKRLEEELKDEQPLLSARLEVLSQQERLAELEKSQRGLEWEIDDLQAKIKPVKEKLYSGVVKSPHELSVLEKQVKSLKIQQEAKENEVLVIMEQVELRREKLTASQAELKQFEEKWQQEREKLKLEQSGLSAEISLIQQKREQILAQSFLSQWVEFYRTLKAEKGRAVVKVERGICQGCRIALPSDELQRIRNTEAIVQCSSCGRILCLG
jgi:hypothetical protein